MNYVRQIICIKQNREEELTNYIQRDGASGLAEVITQSLIGLSTGCGDNNEQTVTKNRHLKSSANL
jgi:hypothetical protein